MPIFKKLKNLFTLLKGTVDTRPLLTNTHSTSTSNSEAESIASPRVNARALVLRHASWASVGTVFNLIFALLSTAVLARLLTPTDFARFVLARSSLAFLGTLGAFGLGTLTLRQLGRYLSDVHPDRKRAYLGKVVPIAGFTLTVAGLTAFVGLLYFGEQFTGEQTSLFLAGLIAFAAVAGGVLTISSDSVRGVGSVGAANMLGNVIQGSPVLHAITLSTVALMALTAQPSWKDAVSAYSLACGVAAVCGCLLLIRQLQTTGETDSARLPNDELPNRSQILNAAWPLAITAIITFILGFSDYFMTSQFSDPEAMSSYIAARRVIVLLAIPMTVLSTAARGLISPLYSANMKKELQRSLRGGGGLVAIPCLAAALLTLVAPGFVLSSILGEGYSGAAPLLQILIPGQVIFVLTGCCGILLNLTGHQRITMTINTIGAVVMLTLGPWVAFRFGAIGLAIQISAAQAILNLVTWAIAWKLTGISTLFSFRALTGWQTLFRRQTINVANDGSKA